MVWFISANYFQVKNKIPPSLEKAADFLIKIYCWKIPEHIVFPPKMSPSDEITNSYKCSKCEECSFCFIKKDTDAMKAAKKGKNDFKIKALNEFFFIIMFLCFFITDLSIFLVIASN